MGDRNLVSEHRLVLYLALVPQITTHQEDWAYLSQIPLPKPSRNTHSFSYHMDKPMPTRLGLKLIHHIHQTVTPNMRVIDLGGGYGELIEGLEQGFLVDLDKTKVERANVENKLVADLNHLPFRSNVFDLATLVEVVEHLETPKQAAREIRRVCKNVLITTPNNSLIRKALWKLRRKHLSSSDHVHEYSPTELRALFAGAGFRLKSFSGLGFVVLKPGVLRDLGEVIPYLSSKILMQFDSYRE